MSASVRARSGWTSREPGTGAAPSGASRAAAAAGFRRSRAAARPSESESAQLTSKPSRASAIEGAITSASARVPYVRSASVSPATVPGTPAASGPSRLRAGMTSPCESRYMSRVARDGAIAKVDGRLAAVSETDHHESAASEVAGRRMRHREREPDRHRGVHGVSAVAQHLDAGPRGIGARRGDDPMTGAHRRPRGAPNRRWQCQREAHRKGAGRRRTEALRDGTRYLHRKDVRR